MRKILFCIGALLIYNSQLSIAQSAFLSQDVFYFDMNVGTIWPIKVDSTSVENGNTTLFFNEGMISLYGSEYNCIDTAGPNILGPKLTVMQNGDYHFYNRYGDTIKIYMNAPVDSIWVCYQDSNLTVSVQVESIENSFFNGVNEAIHTYRFSVEGNTNYNTTIDQRYLKIGEINGLISTFAWVVFPYFFDFLDIGNRIEKSSFHNNQYPDFNEVVSASEADIYNFQIGDEFHVTKSRSHGNPFVYDKELTKLNVLGRSENSMNVSITYVRERQMGLDSIFIDSQDEGHYFYIYNEIVVDTLVETYSKSELKFSMPMYFNDIGANAMGILFERPAYFQSYYYIDAYGADSCAYFDVFYYGEIDEYILGLGGPYYEYYHDNQPGIEQGRELTYFNLVDGSVYGQPVEFVSLNDNIELADFQLFPNPAKTQITIELPANESGLQIQILDMMGRIIYTEEPKIGSQTHVIDISGVEQGVYIVQLTDENSVLGMKRFVKN
jgi:hypothetical protein